MIKEKLTKKEFLGFITYFLGVLILNIVGVVYLSLRIYSILVFGCVLMVVGLGYMFNVDIFKKPKDEEILFIPIKRRGGR